MNFIEKLFAHNCGDVYEKELLESDFKARFPKFIYFHFEVLRNN